MKVAIVYNEPVKGIPDSEDVLNEVSVVVDALSQKGYEYITHGISPMGITELVNRIRDYSPDVIFNLVEDVKLSVPTTALFELLHIPYTGSSYESILITTNKVITKSMFSVHGIPTPKCTVFRPGMVMGHIHPLPAILKPVYEDASVGIDDESVVSDINALMKRLDYMLRRYRQPVLIEEFIDGREFNVSLLERLDGGVEVLPIAEIIFSDWPMHKPRIVGYRAKWDNSSFEFNNTPRRFNPEDAHVNRLKEVSLKCWRVFNLKGYARVDMRMDTDGNIYVIEVNANPCISPDAGFMASANEAGYATMDVIERLLMSATGGVNNS
ncbi:MAG: ATP-grasp domain-containing protein [Thermodesulfovibrionia bacterium]